MSVRLAARRLGLHVTTGSHVSRIPAPILPVTGISPSQRRYKWLDSVFKGWGKSANQKRGDPGARGDLTTADLDDPAKRRDYLNRTSGDRVGGSIFEEEIEAAQATDPAAQRGQAAQSDRKTAETMALVTDPNPRARVRWHRRKVIQMVQRRGQEPTREERIRATERQLLHKSEFMATSVKKLVMLSRQIAGKPVDEAITQMRWSKKKFAAEVRYYLEEARDLAVASRGMGLGVAEGGEGALLRPPRKIQTREGRWIEIEDATRMYVAQSWVGRGPWRGKSIDYKGRGRMGLIKHPSTSLTILLKEEKTRIREYDERVAKKNGKTPWVHHPNRAIHGQRPYYSW